MRYGERNLIARRGVMWIAVFLLAACAPTHVDTTKEYGGKSPLPRPDRVLIYDFAVSGKDVKLNTGIGARLSNLATGANESEEQLKVGRAVAKALSESLMKELDPLGPPVERATPGSRLTERTVAIHGQFLTIDEGNRARRMVIGFGVGGTERPFRALPGGNPSGILSAAVETAVRRSVPAFLPGKTSMGPSSSGDGRNVRQHSGRQQMLHARGTFKLNVHFFLGRVL